MMSKLVTPIRLDEKTHVKLEKALKLIPINGDKAKLEWDESYPTPDPWDQFDQADPY